MTQGDLALLVERLTSLCKELKDPAYCRPEERFACTAAAHRIEFCMYGGVDMMTPVPPAVTVGHDGHDWMADHSTNVKFQGGDDKC